VWTILRVALSIGRFCSDAAHQLPSLFRKMAMQPNWRASR
jgi:hypothetical protein